VHAVGSSKGGIGDQITQGGYLLLHDQLVLRFAEQAQVFFQRLVLQLEALEIEVSEIVAEQRLLDVEPGVIDGPDWLHDDERSINEDALGQQMRQLPHLLAVEAPIQKLDRV
jgi:hypothetical protein